jgi:hypothetical protein
VSVVCETVYSLIKYHKRGDNAGHFPKRQAGVDNNLTLKILHIMSIYTPTSECVDF